MQRNPRRRSRLRFRRPFLHEKGSRFWFFFFINGLISPFWTLGFLLMFCTEPTGSKYLSVRLSLHLLHDCKRRLPDVIVTELFPNKNSIGDVDVLFWVHNLGYPRQVVVFRFCFAAYWCSYYGQMKTSVFSLPSALYFYCFISFLKHKNNRWTNENI